MTVRRVLVVVAVLLGAASILFAAIPFSSTGGEITGPHVHIGNFLLSVESCRAPIVDAWHGKQERWAVSIGPSPIPPDATVKVTTCRGEARHRLLLSFLGLGAAGVLLAVVFIRRPRVGSEPSPQPG